MFIHFTLRSDNRKTGPMMVTTQSEDTCPTTCPHRDGGCYAKHGHLLMHWKAVTRGDRTTAWAAFLQGIRKQQRGALWRYGQAGDLPGKRNRISKKKIEEIVTANRGFRGFTYTHKPLTPTNQELIKWANHNGFTINLSADTLKEADEKAALEIGPVAVTLPADPAKWAKQTPAGRPITICPAVTKGLTCVQCGLCAVARRRAVVGFPAHGTGKRKVESTFNNQENANV